MSVYKKLQQCRVDLQNLNIKKSGKNKFSGYDYFELADILPHINNLFNDHGLCGVVSFFPDLATLRIYDVEKPESQVEFCSPMAEAQLKGCHAIQNLGAVETYQRRYLYMSALEITEHDVLDAVTGKEEKPKVFARKVETKEDVKKVISEKQANYLRHLQSECKLSNDEVKDMIESMGLKSSKELTSKTLDELIGKMKERATVNK